jgi:tRNA A37 N6-isopentenylltransferase MiaA
MIEKAINATRQLSKRQMTWINSWKNLNIIENNSKLRSEVEKLLLQQL